MMPYTVTICSLPESTEQGEQQIAFPALAEI
jgi:hypothetical protein